MMKKEKEVVKDKENNNILDKIKKIITSEVVLYLFFGVLTTLVNMIVFRLLNTGLVFLEENIKYNMAMIVAWIISFIVAFLCNKYFVFKSKSKDKNTFYKEFFEFFAARIFSLVAHLIIANICVSAGMRGDLVIGSFVLKQAFEDLANLIGNAAEIVLNYICSKLFIFKNKK